MQREAVASSSSSSTSSQKAPPKHIGIIGCSAEGASLCYKTICIEAYKYYNGGGGGDGDGSIDDNHTRYSHPEVSMNTLSLSKYVDCLNKSDIEGIANIMKESATKLVKMGAEILICPDNTIHCVFGSIARSGTGAEEDAAGQHEEDPYGLLASLPPNIQWLHIANVVATEASKQKYQRVLLLGTKWLVNCDEIYPPRLVGKGIECIKPSNEEITTINDIIMNELVHSKFNHSSINFILNIIETYKLQNNSCDAVILGCTELPIIINSNNSSLPILDSTRLLAYEALKVAYK